MISVLMNDCLGIIVRFVGFCVESSVGGLAMAPSKPYPTTSNSVPSSVQKSGCFREVADFDKPATTEASHFVGSYILCRSLAPRA